MGLEASQLSPPSRRSCDRNDDDSLGKTFPLFIARQGEDGAEESAGPGDQAASEQRLQIRRAREGTGDSFLETPSRRRLDLSPPQCLSKGTRRGPRGTALLPQKRHGVSILIFLLLVCRQALHRSGLATAQQDENGTVVSDDKDPSLFWSYENETCFLSTVAGETTKVETNVMPGCWNGTGMRLVLDEGNSSSSTDSNSNNPDLGIVSGLFGSIPVVYTNSAYRLDLTVHVDVGEVLMSQGAGEEAARGQDGAWPVAPEQPGELVGFIRLIFCNALQIGSCEIYRGGGGDSSGSGGNGDDEADDDDDGGGIGLSTHVPASNSSRTDEFVNVLYDPSDGYNDVIGQGLPQIQNESVNCMLNLTADDSDRSFLSSPWLAIALYPAAVNSSHSHRPHNFGEERVYRSSHACTVWISPEVTSGAFYVLGHARFDFRYGMATISNASATSNETDTTTTRLEITRAMNNQAALVSAPPTEPFVQIVSAAMKIYIIVASVICGAFALGCLVSICWYRHHPVMTLSQGSFLGALAGSCLVQIAFVFTYLPTKNVYCTLSGPLELVPMNLGASILVARVWRAYSTLGMAALIGRRNTAPDSSSRQSSSSNRRWWNAVRKIDLQKWRLEERYIRLLSWLARQPLRCLSKEYRKPAVRHTIRQKVTAAETASLAAVLTMPQVVLQVFGAAFYHRDLVLQVDTSASVGRYVCQNGGRWVDQAGIGLVGLVYIGAVAAAWIARLLPSVFNEKNQVFHASFVNCLIAFITLPLLELTNDPTDSPDVQVFLRSFLSIGIAMTVLVILIWPKLRRVWSGEKVVLTTVLDARFKAPGVANTPTDLRRTNAQEDPTEDRIHLKEGDPLPRAIEQQVLRLHDVLRTVEDRCCEGRPLTREEWSQLREYTHSLEAELCRIEMKYTHDESDEESPAT